LPLIAQYLLKLAVGFRLAAGDPFGSFLHEFFAYNALQTQGRH
jgi:hypothetical protein